MESVSAPTTLSHEDRRAIAAATQRYVNASLFREMARVIEEWKAEERDRQAAARLLLALMAVGVVAEVVLIAGLALLR